MSGRSAASPSLRLDMMMASQMTSHADSAKSVLGRAWKLAESKKLERDEQDSHSSRWREPLGKLRGALAPSQAQKAGQALERLAQDLCVLALGEKSFRPSLD